MPPDTMTPFVRRLGTLGFCGVLGLLTAGLVHGVQAAPSLEAISYTMRFPAPETHMAEVEAK